MQFSVIYYRYFHQTTENYRSINCQLCKNVSTKRLNNHQVISPSFDLGNQLIKKKVDINWAPIRGGVLSVRSEWMLTVLFVGEPVLPPFTGDRPPFGRRGAHEALNNLIVCRHITAETNKHSKDARFSFGIQAWHMYVCLLHQRAPWGDHLAPALGETVCFGVSLQ